MDQDLADGQLKEQTLRSGGFSDEEIQQWKGQTAQDLAGAGYSPDEVNSYFGQKQPNLSAIKAKVQQGLSANQPQSPADGSNPKREPLDVSPKPIEAKDVWDAMAAAWGNSIMMLAHTGQESPIQMPTNATNAMHYANMGASLLADSPVMMGAGLAGGPIAGFAVPAGIRATLVDGIRNGEFQDAGDFARRVTAISWETAKGAATGAAMAAAGPFGKFIAGTPGAMAAETAAMTTVSSALEGHLPKFRDFADNAIAMAGFHAVTAGIGGAASLPDKLMNIYEKTGALPHEVVAAAEQDPVMKQELLSDNPMAPKEAAPREQEASPVETPSKEFAPQSVKEGYELPDAERSEVLSRIGQEPEESKESMVQKAKDGSLDFYVNTFDKTARIKEVLDKIGDQNLDEKNSYVLARTFSDINSKIDHFVNVGTIDPDTNDINGESLKAVLTDYAKETGDKTGDNLKAWMISARSLELDERGTVQPGDRANDQAIYDAGLEKYGPYAQRMVEYQNRVLNYAKGKGLISQDQFDAIEEAGQNYIPLHKIVEADNITGRTGSANSLKKIGDSLLKLSDPFQSIMRNTEVMVRAADRNALLAQAAKDLFSAENPEDFIKKINPDVTPINIKAEELGKALEVQGITIPPEALDAYTIFRKVSNNLGKDGIFTYREDGELKAVQVDPALAEVMNSYSEAPQAMGIFTSVFRVAAQSLRTMTIQNPLTGFFARHSFRNQEQAAVFSQTGLKPFQALGDLVGKDQDLWNQFIRDGGAVSSIEKIPENYYTDTIKLQDAKYPFIDQAWNSIKSVNQWTHMAIMANDNMIRFKEYSRTLDQGGSRTDAAMNARNVLADFQKEGLKRGFIQATTAFFKAHYQGQFQMMGGLSDPETRMGVLARSIGYITVPSVLLGLAQAGDKRVEELPDWLKWNYWNVHIPHWRDAGLDEAMSQKSAYPDEVRQKPDGSYQVNDGYIFRLPKPFASGTFFGSAIEETLRDYNKKDPEHFASFLKNVAGQMVANPIPTLLEPVLEQSANRNFFAGKPLVRSEMERNKLPEMQYTPYTSEFAKWVGKQVADVPLVRDIGPGDAKLASPIVIQNYIDAYTGGSGKYLLAMADNMMKTKDKGVGAVAQDLMASRWQDVPLAREFLVRHDIEPQVVNDFMDKQNVAQQVQGSIKELLKRGDAKGAADLQAKYAADGFRLPQMQQAIQNMMSMVHKINAQDIDPVQKRQLADGYNYMIISMARQGNEIMEKFKDSVKKGSGGQ